PSRNVQLFGRLNDYRNSLLPTGGDPHQGRFRCLSSFPIPMHPSQATIHPTPSRGSLRRGRVGPPPQPTAGAAPAHPRPPAPPAAPAPPPPSQPPAPAGPAQEGYPQPPIGPLDSPSNPPADMEALLPPDLQGLRPRFGRGSRGRRLVKKEAAATPAITPQQRL